MKVLCFYVASHIYSIKLEKFVKYKCLEKLRLSYICMYSILFFFYFSKIILPHIKGFQQNMILFIDTNFTKNHNIFRQSHSTNVKMVTITCFKNTVATESTESKALYDIFLSHKSGIVVSKCQENVRNATNLMYQNRIDTLSI